jgi:hypothetical protein
MGFKNAHDNDNWDVRGCIQKFPDWVNNEINNKHSLRSNTKGYDGKTHQTDSKNSDTTAPSGRELYHLQFSLQTASPETFGYTLVSIPDINKEMLRYFAPTIRLRRQLQRTPFLILPSTD